MKKYRYCPCGIRIEYPKIRCIACKQEKELREIQKTAKAHKDLHRAYKKYPEFEEDMPQFDRKYESYGCSCGLQTRSQLRLLLHVLKVRLTSIVKNEEIE